MRAGSEKTIAPVLPSARNVSRSYRSAVDAFAYRFVPCDDEGHPRASSQYTTIAAERLEVGSRIEAALLGHDTWVVVEVRDETGPLAGVRDRRGNDIPLAGTVVCRGEPRPA